MKNHEADYNIEPIAVIGMACRFPGANNIFQFWENLSNGIESIKELTESDLREAGVSAKIISDEFYVRRKPILENIDMFDASFFGINQKEAEIMDPQHRIMLECAWEAFENAGYDVSALQGRVGIFTGSGLNSYFLQNLIKNQKLIDTFDWVQIYTANDKDYIPTRISYLLDLKGPSFNVGSACSSSLVAVHVACRNLWNYGCDIALAGGSTALFPQNVGYLYKEGNILSPDGYCRPFDEKAKGTNFGNGAGIVVLKRLEDAIEADDFIYAIVRGTAVSNDGASKVGYTAPGVEGQVQVISEAMALANVHPESISYIETHGTGTTLGDPIEISGLTKAFRQKTQKKQFCALGSVKANIGHLDAAAGIAGFIKTVLSLNYKQIPSTINFNRPNPKIDFENSPFYVNSKLRKWSHSLNHPRRAGISSFGIGGTNAHVILEEFLSSSDLSESNRPLQLATISAKSVKSLQKVAQNLTYFLDENKKLQLSNVAYTLNAGRQAMPYRKMFVVDNIQDMISQLEYFSGNDFDTIPCKYDDLDVVFMFPGQGSQHINMAKELYLREPPFKKEFDHCCKILTSRFNIDLKEIIYPEKEHLTSNSERLRQTTFAQPAIFVIEYSLAQLWIAWGIKPKAMIGHSIGEYVAACISGVISLEDALKIVIERGKLMQSLPPGEMYAVALSKTEIMPLLDSNISIAATNAPDLCVVSGPRENMEVFEKKVQHRGLECIHLHTSHAFHSSMMEPIVDTFRNFLTDFRFKTPLIPYISTVTGQWIHRDDINDPDYLIKNLRDSVQFNEGIEILLENQDWSLLEVGPGTTLSSLVRRHPKKRKEQLVLTSLPHALDKQSELKHIFTTLGHLWYAGAMIDWAGFYQNEKIMRVPLPSYPFEHKRFWIEADKTVSDNKTTNYQTEVRKATNSIHDWLYLPTWKRKLVQNQNREHKFQGTNWLLFVDDSKLCDLIQRNLKKDDCQIIQIYACESYGKLDRLKYQIDPREKKDYDQLFSDLQTNNLLPDHILNLWNIKNSSFAHLTLKQIEDAQSRGFYNLLYLAQSIGKYAESKKVKISVVTTGLHEVTGDENLVPARTTILGPVKVIPKEYPNIFCTNIDIRTADAINNLLNELAFQIIDEHLANQTERIIALRGFYRWIENFDRINCGTDENILKIKQNGTYLITGGTGGIGLTIAEDLVTNFKANVILTSRSRFPDRPEWEMWLNQHAHEDKTSQKILRLKRLGKYLDSITIAQVDAVDYSQMENLVNHIEKQYGKIDGIFHAAGVAGSGIIQLKNREMVENVFRPKIYGTVNLVNIFANRHPDFIMLLSSISAIIGEVGQVDYCAANCFLDSYAYYALRKNSAKIISVNWDTWREVGMAVETEIPKELQKERELRLEDALTRQEGVRIMHTILKTFPLQQIIVSKMELHERLITEKKNILHNNEINDDLTTGIFTDAIKAVDTVREPGMIISKMIILWQDLIGVKNVSLNDSFFELGGHSLIAVQLISRIRQLCQVQLSLAEFFENSTVSQLSKIIEEKLDLNKSEATDLVEANYEDFII